MRPFCLFHLWIPDLCFLPAATFLNICSFRHLYSHQKFMCGSVISVIFSVSLMALESRWIVFLLMWITWWCIWCKEIVSPFTNYWCCLWTCFISCVVLDTFASVYKGSLPNCEVHRTVQTGAEWVRIIILSVEVHWSSLEISCWHRRCSLAPDRLEERQLNEVWVAIAGLPQSGLETGSCQTGLETATSSLVSATHAICF